jgi:hypothetical protein
MPLTPDLLNERLVEAARYALMRRLAPAIRHDMAGVLQPISMMAAMLEKRIQKPAPDMATLGSNSAAISAMSREAANSCMNLMTWLAPKENKPLPLDAAVADSIALLNTEMSFRGFTLVNETAGLEAELPRSVIRSVFMAALVALTDAAKGPAKVVLSASADDARIQLTISLVPTDSEPAMNAPHAYRRLEWDDVVALAEAERVELVYSAERAELRYVL